MYPLLSCYEMYSRGVLVVNPLSSEAARYYRDGPDPGQWCGAGTAALGLHGPVDLVLLGRLLKGRHPTTGAPLTTRPAPHRRSGWDLVFAAPKSVSLVVGLAPPPQADALAGAQRAAVDAAVGWLEARACWARRDGGTVAGEGFVAARFDHRRSSAGDPHLHAHLVLANVVRSPDGRWSALDSSPLWLQRAALSAVYDLALRHHLGEQGLRGGWILHEDGSWDLAGVPRPAVEAASRREVDVARVLPSGETTRRSRRAARVLTRAGDRSGWWAAATAAGFGPAQAAELGSRREPANPAPDPSAAVEGRLVGRRSTWSEHDLVVALAASAPAGATPEQVDEWAERLGRSCLPAGGGRLSSPAAADIDRAVLDLWRRASPGIGLAAPDAVAAALARRPELDPAARAAVRRLTGAGHGVDILGVPDTPARGAGPGPGPLVAQAAVLDAAREAWEATGHRVAIRTNPTGAGRWAALAALSGAETPPGTPPSVVVVDRADRISPRELLELLSDAANVPSKVVLVRGGTLPARRSALCEGMEAIDSAAGHATPSPQSVVALGSSGGSPPRAGGAALSTAAAFESLVEIWRRGGSASRAHLVGLGPAEVAELNRRAREALRAAGTFAGGDVWLAGRPFAVGDRVIPLGREAAGPGSAGLVVEADAGPRGRGSRPSPRVVVDWGAARRPLDSWSARRVGHAYALTPAGLRLRPGAALLLGDPADLGRAAGRVDLALRAGQPAPGRDLDTSRRLTTTRTLVTAPDPADRRPARTWEPDRVRPGADLGIGR